MKPASMVQTCYDAGARHFGENYVQQLVEKAAELPADVKWHFIGQLQSNKARALLSVPNLHVVETVDREKAARALDRAASDVQRVLRVLIQVNTGGEDSKAGVAPAQVLPLVRAVRLCSSLQLAGFMTIGRPGELQDMRDLRDMRDRLVREEHISQEEGSTLSMGMSADYLDAIACGSTSVRVGSTIFGAR